MDEEIATDVNLRGEDVDNLRQMLEYRFPPPKTERQPRSRWPSKASVLDREETPWWWSPSADTQVGRESRVLDSNHLLSSEMLARSLALSAQRTRDKLYSFVQSMAKQRGEDYDEMIDAWDGFGLDFMPRIPKQPGSPPDASYFYKAKIEKDIQNVHIVLQYFAVLLEEILNDQEKYNSPVKSKWLEAAEMLKQLLREVDVVLVTLELPRRRVPRAAIPEYARGLALREAREARDWLAARDLLNAVELLWHVFSVFAAAADARREAQLRASTTALARYGSNYNCARQPGSGGSLQGDPSASQVILPYARLSPVPGRPSGAPTFLYGLTREPLSTPFSSPATTSSGALGLDAHLAPRPSDSATSACLQPPSPLPEAYCSELPRSLSPPSPARAHSPPSSATHHHHHHLAVPGSTPPRRGSPQYAGTDAAGPYPQGGGAPACCLPQPGQESNPFTTFHPGPFSLPATSSRPATLPDSPTHSSPAQSCCSPPPKPQLPPPRISRLLSH